ncbi:MAG: carotenoid oxygenase family protein [Alphaproteobacteria bacterium]|nr:carotenoid oxygenase family protein [Alphaproteobacteria bacterium]MBU0792382.1 carotenoid oxygenase family protein [Alphaproteobacteria bacterium]MBU0877146.1 carotenoid oxygenase family protein [Alphaproteobacteria bacterium]MBU1770720.1 carotenoid oxygenase family protein [Alphaproteobacteria bacterium]
MKFPETPNFTGFFAPSGVEADVRNLPVLDGAIPVNLDGSFYRVAPDPQFPPIAGDDIWFNGDGMVTRFRFRNGEVSLQQRWARTDKFRLERDAGKALFGAYRNPLTDHESVKGEVRGTANTNVILHAGKLLALKEDSPPVWMDPETLETIDPRYDFGGKMTSETFTAHPKIDPRTGEMLAFGYAAKGLCTRDMVFYVISPEGEITKEVWFEIPYYCMMHDFGFTEDYVVFHVVPIVGSWERLEAGLPHFGFDRGKPVHLGVLPRNGTADDIRWFSAPTCFASHVMNAHNEGTKVHFDVPMAAGNMFPFFPDTEGLPFEPHNAAARMTRWTVDMRDNGDDIAMTKIADLVGEFPRVDDRFAGRKNRWGWQLVQDLSKPVDLPGGRSASGMMMNTLGRIDMETGETDTYWVGPTSSLQEPAFVPRPGSTEEGDGYMVVIENRLAEMASRLLLFDAMKLAQGPIATVGLPFRIRQGLHGNWAAAD